MVVEQRDVSPSCCSCFTAARSLLRRQTCIEPCDFLLACSSLPLLSSLQCVKGSIVGSTFRQTAPQQYTTLFCLDCLQEARLEAQAQLEWTQKHVRELSAELAHAQVRFSCLLYACACDTAHSAEPAHLQVFAETAVYYSKERVQGGVSSGVALPSCWPPSASLGTFLSPVCAYHTPRLLPPQSSVTTSAAGVEALVQKVNSAISGELPHAGLMQASASCLRMLAYSSCFDMLASARPWEQPASVAPHLAAPIANSPSHIPHATLHTFTFTCDHILCPPPLPCAGGGNLRGRSPRPSYAPNGASSWVAA